MRIGLILEKIQINLLSLLLIVCALFMSTFLYAQEKNTPGVLPEPLTLEYALSLSGNNHPDNIIIRSQLNQARARHGQENAALGVKAAIAGRIRWVEPLYSDINHDDHYAGLIVTKRLYDSGYSQAKIAAAQSSLKQQRWLLLDNTAQRRLSIIRAYFDVVLSDLAYARDNEAMALAYVRFDRIKDRKELGQVADVDLLKAESTYQKARSLRYASDVRRRAKRNFLANLLNHPGHLPDQLVKPKLIILKRKLPKLEVLQVQALKDNPQLLALRQQVEAARQKLRAARSKYKPVIDFELEASKYTRELRSSDPLRAGIRFEIPLTTGGASRSDTALRLAELHQSEALLRNAELDVQQQVLELWQLIYITRAKRDEAIITHEYREISLDNNRALYELDIKADLGEAMADFVAALYQSASVDYELTLALLQMDAILGKPVSLKLD